METVGERLKRARKGAGYETAADAARAFGWHPQNVRDQEADRRGVSPEQAATYARNYHVKASWVLFGGPNPKAEAPERLVPVIGYVGADPEGVVLFSTGQGTGDLVPIPPGGTDRARALLVRGTSMPGIADDGSLIYFENQRGQPTADMLGHVIVMELETGEVLVKRIFRGSAKGLYDLQSGAGEDRRDVAVTWVADITAVIPPGHARRIMIKSQAA